MGPTHILGGIAALGLVAATTGHTDAAPAWAFVVAGASALIPDADNDRGSMLNRPYLLPLKLMTWPLWHDAAHRGRTHSILGTGAYGAIVLAWGLLLNLLLALLAPDTGAAIPLMPLLVGALAGYVSHLVLDMFNIPGMLLLWPLRVRVFFPPWRAKGPMPGRFETGTMWEKLGVNTPLTLYIGWFVFAHGAQVGMATVSDKAFMAIPGAMLGALVDFLRSAAG